MISRRFNNYLFRHFNPYLEHFQPIHLSFSTPISKTSQPIYRRCIIALIGKILFLWRICNVYESVMLILSIPTHLFRRETFQDSPTILSTPVQWPNYYTNLWSNTKTWQWYWLDLANAYGYIPHQIIQVAMHQYYIQDRVSNLLITSITSL